jgi:hypothetical protein
MPHKYKFMPWSIYIQDVFEQYQTKFKAWFECRKGNHSIKFGSHGRCIYCDKKLQGWEEIT